MVSGHAGLVLEVCVNRVGGAPGGLRASRYSGVTSMVALVGGCLRTRVLSGLSPLQQIRKDLKKYSKVFEQRDRLSQSKASKVGLVSALGACPGGGDTQSLRTERACACRGRARNSPGLSDPGVGGGAGRGGEMRTSPAPACPCPRPVPPLGPR